MSPDDDLQRRLRDRDWEGMNELVVACRRCPRLVEHREQVAREKRAAFSGQEYWGRPVPGFGDRQARLLVVGLAPAAHGANRTGRMFTGDRSGDWLYRAMHRAGFASRPTSEHRDDGLRLDDAYVTATARCAPPDNRLRPEERRNCRPYLEHEVDLLDRQGPGLRVVVPLGQYAYDHVLRLFRDRDYPVPSPKPPFAHGKELALGPPPNDGGSGARDVGQDHPILVASYHPSQQNTFTGTLTEEMFDSVFSRARAILDRK